MKIKLIVSFVTIFVLTSCSEIQYLMKILPLENKKLTEYEINAGLKQALSVGLDSSINRLAAGNGYFTDETVKILLPPEAKIITENLSKIPGGQILLDQVISGINSAASDAAKEAAPLILNSITSMNIQDAVSILLGGDYAATAYLKTNNYDQLVNLFQPKIQASLEKKIAGAVSPQQTWDELTAKWNKIAGSFIGQLASFEEVETNLSKYLTQRALDGLFLKIAETEKNIRKEPTERVTNLLQRVFAPENIAELQKDI